MVWAVTLLITSQSMVMVKEICWCNSALSVGFWVNKKWRLIPGGGVGWVVESDLPAKGIKRIFPEERCIPAGLGRGKSHVEKCYREAWAAGANALSPIITSHWILPPILWAWRGSWTQTSKPPGWHLDSKSCETQLSCADSAPWKLWDNKAVCCFKLQSLVVICYVALENKYTMN